MFTPSRWASAGLRTVSLAPVSTKKRTSWPLTLPMTKKLPLSSWLTTTSWGAVATG